MVTQETVQSYIEGNSRGVIRPGLSRVRELLRRLGDPQDELRFLHVAGTNGKGSTCAMLESVLRCAGYRTGLYTSPHLERLNEELKVNGKEIPDQALTDLLSRTMAQAEQMEDTPSRFEIMTAAALLYFCECGCEIVILETGMGGSEDATNVIPPPEVCVITNIGLDHTEYLGDTVVKIARHKAGIIKEGADVVSYDLPQEVRSVIDAACRRQHARVRYADFSRLDPKVLLTGRPDPVPEGAEGSCVPEMAQERACRMDPLQHFEYKGISCTLSLSGIYQCRNAACVAETVDVLRARGYRIPQQALIDGLSAVSWPARFEILCRRPLVILDGGHNPQCADAFAQSLRQIVSGPRWNIVLGVLSDKDIETILDLLAPCAKQFFCVPPQSERALASTELCEIIRGKGYQATAYEAVEEALSAVETQCTADAPAAVFGSMYLAAAVRRYFGR